MEVNSRMELWLSSNAGAVYGKINGVELDFGDAGRGIGEGKYNGQKMSQDNTNSSFSTSTRSFYIENLGCSKNQVDAEIMTTALLDRGWKFFRHEPEKASYIIINTCGFIESAKEEAVNTILRALREYPDKKIIASGCMAQRYGNELRDQIPELTAVFGNKNPPNGWRIFSKTSPKADWRSRWAPAHFP